MKRIVLWLALWGLALPAHADRIALAAAADLQPVLAELKPLFENQSGHQLQISLGSSGQLAAQIEQGAPFELLLSADEASVQRLADAGWTRGPGRRYAVGRLALFAPTASPLRPELGLAGLKPLLKAGRLRFLAIANPRHAPYGRAAREALSASGLWELLSGHLVLAENAAQAAQFSVSGSSEGGLIPLSLALALRGQGRFNLIPAELHAPLQQRMVLLKAAGPAATLFYNWLQQGVAQQALLRHGFSLPEP